MDKKHGSLWIAIGIAGAIFVVTRKKYVILIPDFVLPKTSKSTSLLDTIKAIKDAINIKLTKTQYGYGYRLTLKPILGVNIPLSMDLPLTAPLAIPQIYAQLDKKVKITPVKVLGFTVAEKVHVDPIEVWM